MLSVYVVSLYDKFGLMSERTEDICLLKALEKSRLTPCGARILANVRIISVSRQFPRISAWILYCLKLKSSLCVTFFRLIVWVYLLLNLPGELRRTHILCSRVQGHPRSLIFGLIESACAISVILLVINTNLGSIWYSLWDKVIGYWLEITIFIPLSFSALGPGNSFWISGKALRILKLESFMDLTVKILWSWLRVVLTQYSSVISRQTDGQTHRQTTGP